MTDRYKKIYTIQFITILILMIYGIAFCSGIKITDHYLFHREEINEYVPEQGSHLDHALLSNFAFNDSLLCLNGEFHKLMGHKEMNGIIKLNNGYLLYPFEEPDYETLSHNATKMSEMRNYLAEKNIALLYCVAPFVVDRNDPQLPPGVTCSGNEDIDKWVALLKETGIDTIDFRDEFENDGIDHYSMFYRTDHHWTISAGFYAFRKISEHIESETGCTVDPRITDIASYSTTIYPEKHLGSSGQKVSRFYSEADDFELITPDFNTSLICNGEHGTFEEMIIDMDALEKKDLSSRYTYDTTYQNSRKHYINELAQNDIKILMVADSYATSVDPWLVLGYREIMTVDANPSKSLIEEYNPDVVVFLYYPLAAFNSDMYLW